VKIAIVDTGCQLPESTKLVYEDQLMECRSWLGHPNNADGTLDGGNEDEDGHGTHAAGLLLDVAPPSTEIYSARVFRSRSEQQGSFMVEQTAKHIAHVTLPTSSFQYWSKIADIMYHRQYDMLLMYGTSTLYPYLLGLKGSRSSWMMQSCMQTKRRFSSLQQPQTAEVIHNSAGQHPLVA